MSTRYLDNDERELVFVLAEKLTGTCQSEKYRRDVLLANVERRMSEVNLLSLEDYLAFALENEGEYHHLISALTIHTTSWFRESPHFDLLERSLNTRTKHIAERPFRLLCAACSTGAEVYSFALLLEGYRKTHPGFEYDIIGVDIDPISLRTAKDAVYSLRDVSSIPSRYRSMLLKGSGRYSGSFTVAKEIRSRCSFQQADLGRLDTSALGLFDQIVCRNVLIYFSPEEVQRIVMTLSQMLHPQGILCLGHSEALPPGAGKLKPLGHSTYERAPVLKPGARREREKILVVDDSTVVRRIITRLLADRFEVVEAESAEQASDQLRAHSVDLITLDLRMPNIDGPTWLKEQRMKGMRTPVIIVSDAAPAEAMDVLGALENGAQEYIEKSRLKNRDDVLQAIEGLLSSKSRTKTERSKSKEFRCAAQGRPDLLILGASTGGTEALTKLLTRMPSDAPPVMIVQHITHAFSRAFADRLCASSGLKLGDMTDGSRLQPGHLYISLSDYHISASERGGNYYLRVSHEPPVCRCRPSVDVLFRGVADMKRGHVLAVLLTGMGADGANGLLALKNRGFDTFVQDEESCVVYGMPREAVRLGAANFVGNLGELRMQIDYALRMRSKNSADSSQSSLAQPTAQM